MKSNDKPANFKKCTLSTYRYRNYIIMHDLSQNVELVVVMNYLTDGNQRNVPNICVLKGEEKTNDSTLPTRDYQLINEYN